MNKILAIITIGLVTAGWQANAQETQSTEKKIEHGVQNEALDERAQPAADYQHNQYGTYPQGDGVEAIPQIKTEISKNDLPESVLSAFESSEYRGQEIVAIYEVKEDGSEMQSLSNESTNDPTHHNELNERSRIESNNYAEANNGEITSSVETETTLDEDVEEGNTIDPRPTDSDISQGIEKDSVMYEIKVKGDDTSTVLMYSEEGELEKTSEESEM